MDGPKLPLLCLRAGPWQAEVFDPRPDPLALGARYVHGGYIAKLSREGQALSARPQAQWDPYIGQGLPEVFEMPLAWGAAAEGEELLRIGSGRIRAGSRSWCACGELSAAVHWQLSEQTSDSCTWECEDATELAGARYAYRLQRRLQLDAQGLSSSTRLQLDCPWAEAMIWFAHPFFAAEHGAAVQVRPPLTAVLPQSLQRHSDGFVGGEADGGFATITGLHGAREPLRLRGCQAIPGGELDLVPDWPLDKLVFFATDRAVSVEPYLARACHRHETASWTLRYAWS